MLNVIAKYSVPLKPWRKKQTAELVEQNGVLYFSLNDLSAACGYTNFAAGTFLSRAICEENICPVFLEPPKHFSMAKCFVTVRETRGILRRFIAINKKSTESRAIFIEDAEKFLAWIKETHQKFPDVKFYREKADPELRDKLETALAENYDLKQEIEKLKKKIPPSIEEISSARLKDAVDKDFFGKPQNLSKMTGVDEGLLLNWLNFSHLPPVTKVIKVADAIGCSLDWLCGRSDK